MTNPDPSPIIAPLTRAKLRGQQAKRRRELQLPPTGPWKAVVSIDAVTTNHGRHSTIPQDHVFEVIIDWTGPPALGMPASNTPVQSRDAYALPNYDDAARLARAAHDAYSHPPDPAEPPDLRQLAQRL